MKKLTAMLLALCMLLAAIPALGEEVTGTWYGVLADVTLATLQLNEDGSLEASLPGVEATAEDNWKLDGDTVTVTIAGGSLDFAYDGATLTSPEYPIPIGREPGTIPFDTAVAALNGGEYEVPEGMTEIDVMSAAMTFLAEYQALVASMTPATPEPAADPELTVLQESFKVTESYSGFRATYIAKVQNNTEAPFFIKGGTMAVTDAAGNQVGEAKYLGSCGSKYLEPGEISFISMYADIPENVEVTYTTTFDVKAQSYSSTDRAVTVADPAYVAPQGYDGAYMKVTVINDSEESLPDINVVLVLEDAEGNLLALDTEGLYRHELGANSTFTFWGSVDSRVSEYCAANGIEPASVEAFAWVENND